MPAEFRTLKGVHARRDSLSFNHIKQFAALNSELANYLKPFASESAYYRKWDFDGDTVIDDFWTLDADTTATGFAIPAAQELAGVISASSGATAEGAVSMRGPRIFKGDKRAAMHVHFKLDDVVDIQFEMGFVDTLTDWTLPAITDVDTPAAGNGVGDAALVHLDTDQTLKTMALVGDSSATAVCTKTDIGTVAPTANTVMCVRVFLDVNDIAVFVDNERAHYKVLSDGVEGGTLLRPWVYFRTREADAIAPTIDLIELMGER